MPIKAAPLPPGSVETAVLLDFKSRHTALVQYRVRGERIDREAIITAYPGGTHLGTTDGGGCFIDGTGESLACDRQSRCDHPALLEELLTHCAEAAAKIARSQRAWRVAPARTERPWITVTTVPRSEVVTLLRLCEDMVVQVGATLQRSRWCLVHRLGERRPEAGFTFTAGIEDLPAVLPERIDDAVSALVRTGRYALTADPRSPLLVHATLDGYPGIPAMPFLAIAPPDLTADEIDLRGVIALSDMRCLPCQRSDCAHDTARRLAQVLLRTGSDIPTHLIKKRP